MTEMKADEVKVEENGDVLSKTNDLRVIKAYDIGTLSRAYKSVDKASDKYYMGSGVTIAIKNTNAVNNTIVEEVLIVDGLSKETIDAIKRDIKRTYDLRLSFNRIKG